VQPGEVFVQVAQLHGFGVGAGVGAGVGVDVCLGLGGVVALPAPDGWGVEVGCPPEPDCGDDAVDPGEFDGCAGSAPNGVCDPGPGWLNTLGPLGDGIGLANPPTVSTVAVTAPSAPVPAQEPTPPRADQTRPILGI
jgi:hypothetical protein